MSSSRSLLQDAVADTLVADEEPRLETGRIRTLPMGSFGVNPIGSTWQIDFLQLSYFSWDGFNLTVLAVWGDQIEVIQAEPSVHVSAVADSFLRQGAPNTNEGANPRLRIQDAGNNRALVAFDLTGVPLDRVTRATLVLTIEENADNWGRNNNRTVNAHPLLTGFMEGNGKAAGLPNLETARGSGPGVTWNCAVDADIANQKPDCSARWNGGDFGPASAAPVVHFNGLTGDVAWDVTADVQAGTTGWLIKKTNEALSGEVSYHSKEGAGDAGTPAVAPRLIVELE